MWLVDALLQSERLFSYVFFRRLSNPIFSRGCACGVIGLESSAHLALAGDR